jgi:hypothetical protein
MSGTSPLLIEAVVDDVERPALVAASEQLGECLGAATGGPWPIRLSFRGSAAEIDVPSRPTIVVMSLLPEVAGNTEPLAQTEARWREHLVSLVAAGIPCVLICTVFRHVPENERLLAIERIRRLNLLAAELSHDTGVGVVDIDRVFAFLGARALQTDYRLGGPMAAEIAAHTIVSIILAAGLDDFIPPDVQERARKYQGNLREIGALVRRRLKRAGRRETA